MKIAVVLSRCSPLGPFIVARDIVNQLHENGVQIDVYYLRNSDEKLVFKTKVRKINFRKSIPFHSYDIVHSHGFVADAYMYFHKASIKTAQVTTIHQRIAPDYSMKYNRMFGQLFETIWCQCFTKRTTIITLTKYLKKYYSSRIDAHSIQYIYNGIELPEQIENLTEEELNLFKEVKKDYKIIGIVSRLAYLKGIDQAIKCLTKNNNLALVVIGDGEKKEELESLANSLGVRNRCYFLGYKTTPIRFMRQFDVFLMPSRSEGFGLSTIEAASQRIPIVCSDLPVYSEIFNPEDVSRFELENIDSLNQAIQKALATSTELVANAYLRYREKFTASIMAQQYLSLYSELIKK